MSTIFVSLETIAARIDVTKPTAIKAMKLLQKKRYLQRKSQGIGKSSFTNLHQDAIYHRFINDAPENERKKIEKYYLVQIERRLKKDNTLTVDELDDRIEEARSTLIQWAGDGSSKRKKCLKRKAEKVATGAAPENPSKTEPLSMQYEDDLVIDLDSLDSPWNADADSLDLEGLSDEEQLKALQKEYGMLPDVSSDTSQT